MGSLPGSLAPPSPLGSFPFPSAPLPIPSPRCTMSCRASRRERSSSEYTLTLASGQHSARANSHVQYGIQTTYSLATAALSEQLCSAKTCKQNMFAMASKLVPKRHPRHNLPLDPIVLPVNMPASQRLASPQPPHCAGHNIYQGLAHLDLLMRKRRGSPDLSTLEKSSSSTCARLQGSLRG